MKKIILLNICIILIALVAIEICFSFIFYLKDVKAPLVLSKSVIDFPYVYYTFIPTKSDNYTVGVNEDGLYSPYRRQKPDDTIRVVLLGGSTARGMFASIYGNTISAHLERLLQKDFPAIKIEVINGGMSGYVLEQLFIFYQLILSKYEPDIVIGLNGYNDLMSVKLNRYSGIYFTPQNMQQFMVIKEGKLRNTFLGRVSHIFPSIFRMADFIKRYISKKNQYDFSSFNAKTIKEATQSYVNISRDMHDFCMAKGSIYLEFLQPLKWYLKEDINGSIKNGGIPQLINLYSAYDEGLTRLDYGYSLTDLFKNQPEIFIDDCHVLDAGNNLIATAMLTPIKKEISKIIKKIEKPVTNR